MSVTWLRKLEDTTVANPNYPEMLENMRYFDSDTVEEPNTNTDNNTNDTGSLEHSRKDETQVGMLYPFISDYDNMCIWEAYRPDQDPLSIYSRHVVLLL